MSTPTIPSTQKAYKWSQFTGIENLVLHSNEKIEKPQRKQVLVRLHAASLNYRDYLVANGTYLAPCSAGLIPLSDGAGEIVQVGQDVTQFKVGDRVAGTFFENWQDGEVNDHAISRSLGGGSVPGVLQQYRVFEEDGLVKIPNYLTYEQASTLPCAALTAWVALVENGLDKVGPNSTVLIIGTGGVSLFGLQFAISAGAKTIVLSSSDEKLEKAKALGATHLVNYRKHPDWHVQVKELTNGRGVDHVVEVGGDGTLFRSLNSVRKGGHVHMIGVLSKAQDHNNLAGVLLSNLINLKGIFVGSRGSFERMNRAFEQHAIQPVIDSVFEFEKAKEALEYLASGKHFGKIVIKID